MRSSVTGIKNDPHPLMSVFARCRRSFFRALWRVDEAMGRCTGLEAGVSATVDRSLIRGLDTDRTMGSSRGCLALSTSKGLKPLQDEDEGSPSLRPAPRLVHRRYAGVAYGDLLRPFHLGMLVCAQQSRRAGRGSRPGPEPRPALRRAGRATPWALLSALRRCGGMGDGPEEAERLAGDRRHRHGRQLAARDQRLR